MHEVSCISMKTYRTNFENLHMLSEKQTNKQTKNMVGLHIQEHKHKLHIINSNRKNISTIQNLNDTNNSFTFHTKIENANHNREKGVLGNLQIHVTWQTAQKHDTPLVALQSYGVHGVYILGKFNLPFFPEVPKMGRGGKGWEVVQNCKFLGH